MEHTKIDDFAAIRRISDVVPSPDGRKVAVTVNTASVEEDRYYNDVWIWEDGNMRRLTGMGDASSPLWEDDEHLLFAADRAKEAKPGEPLTVYYRIGIRGGEAVKAFSLPLKVTSLREFRDGRYLAGAVFDNDAEGRKERDGRYAVFDELPFWANGKGFTNKLRNRIYVADPADGSAEPVTPPLFQTKGFVWDRETDLLAYWGSEYDAMDSQKSTLFLRHMGTGAETEVPLGGRYGVHGASFALGGLLFLASTGETLGTSENPRVYLADTATGAFRELMAPDVSFGNSVGSDVHSAGTQSVGRPEGLYHVETLGYRSHVCLLDGDGIRVLTPESRCVDALAEKDGVLWYTDMAFNGLQELYVKRPGEVPVRVSSFNGEFLASRSLSVPEHFSFTDSDGVEIDGWVMKPADYEEGMSYPAVLDVHGGPRAAYGDVYFHEMQYWAARGYFVFYCNPRGGSGRGDAFADILGENYGLRDYNDLMEFTDEVLKRYPAIDGKRVCMTGGSYGGFMANWILGHTDRFAAVASQRSISNYVSKCLTTDIGYYHNLSAMRADPWSAPEKMWDRSPLKYADRAVTPTLFIQSDEDYRCWMGDAVQMLQALLMHGVPARMCLFKGENHELSRNGKPVNRISRLREITEWFDRWCG